MEHNNLSFTYKTEQRKRRTDHTEHKPMDRAEHNNWNTPTELAIDRAITQHGLRLFYTPLTTDGLKVTEQ